jgi:hypothetical protein
MKIAAIAFGIGLAATSGLALAQISSVTANPTPAKTGQPVNITVDADGAGASNCGLIVHFDDGSESRQVKIDGQQQKFPVTIPKTYAKPGTYSIRAEGKKITTHLGCTGRVDLKLVVEGAAAATGPCPEKWKQAGKTGKAGDFSCSPGKGAVVPKDPMTCPAGTEYYVDGKAKKIGCRLPKKK